MQTAHVSMQIACRDLTRCSRLQSALLTGSGHTWEVGQPVYGRPRQRPWRSSQTPPSVPAAHSSSLFSLLIQPPQQHFRAFIVTRVDQRHLCAELGRGRGWAGGGDEEASEVPTSCRLAAGHNYAPS
jgi:hypothetical protein